MGNKKGLRRLRIAVATASKVSLFAVCITTLPLCVPARAQAPLWKAGVASVKLSNEDLAPGSGFVVSIEDNKAFILTAKHVVKTEKFASVVFQAEPLGPPYIATVKRSDADIALLIVDNPPRSIIALPESDESQPVSGTAVDVGGYPSSEGGRFMSFSTSATEKNRDLTLFQKTPQGYSGGPVLRDGAIVGMVYGEAAFGRAIASSSLRSFLNSNDVAWGSRPLSAGNSESANCSSATAESLRLSLKSQTLPRVLENLRCRPENVADAESQSIVSKMFDVGNFASFRHFLDGLSKTPLFVAPVVCSSAHRAIYSGNFDALAWLLSNSSGNVVQNCAEFTSDLTSALTLAPPDFLPRVISQLKTAGLAVEHDEYALFRAAFEGYVGYDFPRLKQLSDITAPGDAEHFNEAKSRAEAHVMSTTPLFVQGRTDPMYERSRQIIQKRMDEYCPESMVYCAHAALATKTPPSATVARPEFIDNETRLMWTAAASGSAMDWPHALEYCTSLSQAGHRDWRLPGVDELMRLYDTSQRSSGCQTRGREPITVHIKEGINPSCGDVWTGKKSARQLRLGGYTFDYAWLFDFAVGAPKEEPATWLGTATAYHHHVLCVRSNTR